MVYLFYRTMPSIFQVRFEQLSIYDIYLYLQLARANSLDPRGLFADSCQILVAVRGNQYDVLNPHTTYGFVAFEHFVVNMSRRPDWSQEMLMEVNSRLDGLIL